MDLRSTHHTLNTLNTYALNMPRKGQTQALTPEQADRYRRVVQLRTAGVTFDQIAESLGYASRSGAKEAYDAALLRWGRQAVDEHRDLEDIRLEELWRRTFARIADASADEVDEFVKLVGAAVRVSKRRADLLGLDAPRQVEVSGQNGEAMQTDVGEILRERLRQLEQ